jgi:curved DNA-binding protein CbpA
LLRSEALDVLALRPGATAAEIKEAYRDLVKVWHPDRFGIDQRLRRKAEEKLQEINRAYRVLQSIAETDRRNVPPSKRVDVKRGESSVRRKRSSFASFIKDGAKRNRIVAIGVSSAAAVCVAIVWALSHETSQPRGPEIPAIRAEAPVAPSRAEPAPQQELPASPKDTNRSHPVKSTPFRVRQLSDAEVAQLESNCPKGALDAASYQKCVEAQLDPPAPDLSALDAADRRGIESACGRTKQRDGRAAYNRCLTRMIKLLEKSR